MLLLPGTSSLRLLFELVLVLMMLTRNVASEDVGFYIIYFIRKVSSGSRVSWRKVRMIRLYVKTLLAMSLFYLVIAIHSALQFHSSQHIVQYPPYSLRLFF